MLNNSGIIRIGFLSVMIAVCFLGKPLQALELNAVEAPASTEIEKYLLIGTADNDDGEAVNVQNTEVGANRVFLSDGSTAPNSSGQAAPSLKDVFFQGGDRWDSADAVPTGAAPVYTNTAWDGNIAITNPDGQISLSDVDLFAESGIECAAPTTSACKQSVSSSKYFADTVPSGSGVDIENGITTNIDFQSLSAEMSSWASFIEALPTDVVITENIENQNAKDGSGPLHTSFTDLDGNGITVIDINRGGNDFEIVNSDWILDGSENQLYIFRILNGSNVNISNSSLLLGDGGIAGGASDTPVRELGAIFYHASEGGGSSDTVFNMNNVILNGIAMWDFNSSAKNVISVSNAQGCAQFLSAHVSMSNIRFSHCSLTQTTSNSGLESQAYYPANGQFGTLLFEDNIPYKGDFDFNDLVVRYNVTVKRNSNTNNITEIIWHHIIPALGAGYDNAFGVELPIEMTFDGTTLTPGVTLADTSSLATICLSDGSKRLEIGRCTGNSCPIDTSCNGSTAAAECSLNCSEGICTTSGICNELPLSLTGLAVVKFFPSDKDFSGRSGFFNVSSANESENWSASTPFQWQVVLNFSGLGVTELDADQYCALKGKVECKYPSVPPYNPFIMVKGQKVLETVLIHA